MQDLKQQANDIPFFSVTDAVCWMWCLQLHLLWMCISAFSLILGPQIVVCAVCGHCLLAWSTQSATFIPHFVMLSPYLDITPSTIICEVP